MHVRGNAHGGAFDGLAREGFVCKEACPVSLGGIVEI